MTASRHVYDVPLQPVLGSTFQPTGFPDLGAATFDRFDPTLEGTVPALLVESVQSMANRLEATAWDAGGEAPVATMDGLPYVRVVRAASGEFLTSSRLEAHRLASPFIREATLEGQPMGEEIGRRFELARDTPLRYPRMATALMGLDPFCLVHGVFFSQRLWPGQPKFPRAVSAVIEAHDVRRAVSGGRKSDHVRHGLDGEEAGGGTAEGYGSVPFHRTEWTARKIVASFVVDVDLLRSYGLPQPATELLETVALWEIRSLLSGGLRLRTACDLELAGDIAVRRGDALPELADLQRRLRELVGASADLLGGGKPIQVEWAAGRAGSRS